MQKSGNLPPNISCLRVMPQQPLHQLGSRCYQIATGQHSSRTVFPEKHVKSSKRSENNAANEETRKSKPLDHRIDIVDENSDLLGYEVFSGKLVLDKRTTGSSPDLQTSAQSTNPDAVDAKLTSNALLRGSPMLYLDDVIFVLYNMGLRHFAIYSSPIRKREDFRFLASNPEETQQWGIVHDQSESIPIGIIPAGSDNSLVWTVLGLRDPVSAAVAIVKDSTAILFTLIPLVLFNLSSWYRNGSLPTLPFQLYQVWLLFLYASLALRENILRVNGSDIRPWWICRHYCAMVMALVSLTLEIKGQPNSHMQSSLQLSLLLSMMQGLVMFAQNLSREKLCRRIALGKAKRMGVVCGGTAGANRVLRLLFLSLFYLQVLEAYIGLILLKPALVGVISEWQVIVCGLLRVVMAVGNFVNTVQALMSKSRFIVKDGTESLIFIATREGMDKVSISSLSVKKIDYGFSFRLRTIITYSHFFPHPSFF